VKAFIARISTSFVDVPEKIAAAIFFAGCSIRCPGCQNEALWDKASGTLLTLENVLSSIQANRLAESVAFLGGEPTDQLEFLIALAQKIDLYKALYTGREFENLPVQLLNEINFIVCGPFRQDLLQNGFPASSNQRIFNKVGDSWICQNSQ